MSQRAIILSIRPKYAEKIFKGEKTIELRRVRPKELQKGSLVLVYISSPVKCLYGAFTVKNIIEEPLNKLWTKVRKRAALDRQEYNAYFNNARRGIGIVIAQAWCLSSPLKLKQLQSKHGFCPPQCFQYLDSKNRLLKGLTPQLV